MATQAKKGVGIWALIIKLGPKALSLFLKLFKVIFTSKVGLAAASFAGWSLLLSWQFALVLLGSIFFHEMGHVWAMKRAGMKVKGVYFLPFMGAAAVTESNMPSRGWQLIVSLMGPIWGLGLALVTFAGYMVTGSPLWAALAGWMAMLNLFNLLPINPLDGGKALGSITMSISSTLGLAVMAAGLAAGIVLAWQFGLSLIWLMIIAGALEMLVEVRQARMQRALPLIRSAVAKQLGTAEEAAAVATSVRDRLIEQADQDSQHVLNHQVGFAVAQAYLEVNRVPVEKARNDLSRSFGVHGFDDGGTDTWHVGNPERLAESLGERGIPAMKPLQSVGAGLAYVGLTLALIALLFATRHVPGADLALQMFTN